MPLCTPLIRESDIALFLDVDGTLLEIAPTPQAVRVPAALRNTLQLAAQREGGALALISGRSLADLDALFGPNAFAAAGLHGLERRNAAGEVVRPAIDAAQLNPARNELEGLQLRYKGLLLEDKGSALAMHYRLAPRCEQIVRETMERLCLDVGGQFFLRSGKFVIELCPLGYTKRGAIEAFMSESPFAGRTPVFIGDDVTDEDGFAAVNDLHGYSIRVGSLGVTQAKYGFASVSGVIAWLRQRNLGNR